MTLDRYDWIFVVIGSMFLLLLVVAAIAHGMRMTKLMEDCMADGKKEYECHGIIYGRR